MKGHIIQGSNQHNICGVTNPLKLNLPNHSNKVSFADFISHLMGMISVIQSPKETTVVFTKELVIQQH